MRGDPTQASPRRVHARCLVALIAATLALAVVPSAPAAYTEQYWSAGYIVPNTSIYSGWHNWRQNKMSERRRLDPALVPRERLSVLLAAQRQPEPVHDHRAVADLFARRLQDRK